MPGFSIQYGGASDLSVIDLGHPDVSELWSTGPVRAAWSYRKDSRHWFVRRRPGELLVIDGQPDRYPREEERAREWLAGRWGSFRGFEVLGAAEGPPAITIFTDPLGTRPVYFLAGSGQVTIADRLSSVVANAPEPLEIHWSGLLESIALASLYSRETTIRGADFLAPGESAEFRGWALARRMCNEMPSDPDVDPGHVRSDPAGSLLEALRKAVQETWTDHESWLLLSGGLDSRLTLALAGAPRKALTIDMYPEETEIAREIAAACSARHATAAIPAGHYRRLLATGHLITGGMLESRFVNNLGMGREWQQRGISAVTHAFLYDTLLKGYSCRRARKAPRDASVLSQAMGSHAWVFRRDLVRATQGVTDALIGLFSDEGRELAAAQLRRLAETIGTCVAGDIDVSFEKLLLGQIARHPYYGCLLGWFEELDVTGPIFHPAPWSWYAASDPAERFGGKAFREALLGFEHPVRSIRDANTGRAIALQKRPWRDWLVDQPFSPVLRFAWRRWNALRAKPVKLALAAEFREPAGAAILEDSLTALDGSPLFDLTAILETARRFHAGEDAPLEPLLALASAGQWVRFVQQRGRTVQIQPCAK